ncbi:cell wall biogenesis regulatory protein [Bacillus sp. TS-2]|nr:cell wall biogenesis regulatory protein [Bacillus sp. TS-2]
MISLVHVDRQFQSMKKEILECVEKVLDSGQYILGEQGELFEKEASDYLNNSFTVNVANGTDALVLALRALDIGVGDEIITTPFTFFATAEAISRVRATPVFVDIDPITFNIDENEIEKKVTNRTKAIIPVHLFGQACNMNQIKKIADKHNLYIVEDACQAFGGEWKGAKLGTIGDIGCFSFFPTKNLSTIGDGGLVVTKHQDIAERIKKLRHHGSRVKYLHDEVGYNSRLDELHASILRVCLTKIDRWNEERYQKALIYKKHLNDLSAFILPPTPSNKEHVYHLYCVEHPDRDKIVQYLSKKNIASGIYYPEPLHLQNVYQHLGYSVGDFPTSEEKSKSLFALPMHPFLTEEEQMTVIDALKKYEQRNIE